MTNNNGDLGIIELFRDETRRRIITHALNDLDTEEWVRKGDIIDAVDRSHEGAKTKIDSLVTSGVLDIKNWDARLPMYRRAETNVTALLQEWRELDGYPLTELFVNGAHSLIRFYFTQANPDESYSYGAIKRNSDASMYAVQEHMSKLVDSGFVQEVDGKRGTEYQFNPDSDIARFLYALNEAVVECNKEREFQRTD